ncbi:DUF2269 domain-containing protein [Pseudonocardia sp.]|uniref:DUF2269 domain-containing protein n=1 Tax=Pseudonocardia sp. TaxID=60912 RepID=UPI003D115C9D
MASSVGWLGAALAFLTLAVSGLTSDDAQLVRSIQVALAPMTWFGLVPLSLAALATGLVQSLGTDWGVVRHYWVLIKFGVTLLAVVVLLQQLEPIAFLAREAAAGRLGPGDHRLERISLIVHSGGGLAVLLLPLALSIYKPRGRTRYGRRRSAGMPGGMTADPAS